MKIVLNVFFIAVTLLLSGYMLMPKGINNLIMPGNTKTGIEETHKIVNKRFAEEYPLSDGEKKRHVENAAKNDMLHKLLNRINGKKRLTRTAQRKAYAAQ